MSPDQIDGEPSKNTNTLIAKAFESIRRDIIAAKLRPGEKLRIAQLREQYGVGASPLREALSRLVSEGLVTAEGQRGFWVPPVSIEEYEDIVETRIVLETVALRASIEHGDEAWEAQIAGAYHNLNRTESRFPDPSEAEFAEWWNRNRIFHDALLDACPLKMLLRFHGVVFDLQNRYHRYSIRGRDLSSDLFEDHRLIMEATLARDADRAVDLTVEHIRRAPVDLPGGSAWTSSEA